AAVQPRANQENVDITRQFNGEVLTGRVLISSPILPGNVNRSESKPLVFDCCQKSRGFHQSEPGINRAYVDGIYCITSSIHRRPEAVCLPSIRGKRRQRLRYR
ncbi:hypothetical protein CK815_03730, partial [Brucella abortus]